jgi:hypothetical protein
LTLPTRALSGQQIMSSPPPEVIEGVGERMANTEARQQVFADLFVKLVAGDVAADLPLERR